MRRFYQLATALWVLAVVITPALAQQDDPPPLLAEHKAELIQDLSTGLKEVYVFLPTSPTGRSS